MLSGLFDCVRLCLCVLSSALLCDVVCVFVCDLCEC